MKTFSIQKFDFITSIALILLFLSIFVWLMNTKPVLAKWYYGINYGSICDPLFVVLNPLRNREAEKVADDFLEKIKAGKLELLNKIVLDEESLKHIKNSESKSKVISWFAGDRMEEENKTAFTYWIERDYDGSCQSMPTGIEVEKINNIWKVVKFNPTY